jgi:hypothetical protein
MGLSHAIPFKKCQRSADVIQSQAEKLGYAVEADQASTGTVYLTVKHPALCECDDADCEGECADLFIRVADHEPNEARYLYRVNREPDLDVEVGFQVAAVRWLAKKIGVDPLTVAYVKATATKAAKAQAVKEAAAKRHAELAANWAAECARQRATAIWSAANAITTEEAGAILPMRSLSRHEASLAISKLLRGRADGISLTTLFEAANKKIRGEA